MPYDSLLCMTGTVGTTIGSENTTITTNVNGATVFVGRNRSFHGDMRVSGTIGGTTGTLTVSINEQTTSSGTTFQTVARFPDVTSTMAGTTISASNETGPNTIQFQTTRDWIRFSATLSSTASASGVEIRLRPSPEPALP